MNLELLKQARAELQAHWQETTDAMGALDKLIAFPMAARIDTPIKAIVAATPEAARAAGIVRRSVKRLQPGQKAVAGGSASGLGLVETIEKVLPYMVEPFSSSDLRFACRGANSSLTLTNLGDISAWLKRGLRKGQVDWDDDASGYRRAGQFAVSKDHKKPLAATAPSAKEAAWKELRAGLHVPKPVGEEDDKDDPA